MIPPNLLPLVDADILRYEIGYAAEVGWRAKTQTEGSPPFSYVAEVLHQKLADMCSALNTNQTPKLYMTEGRTFRYDLAKKRPYKAGRKADKPWHFDNLTVYMRDVLNAEVVTGIEADDMLAIIHSGSQSTILCSRDKDLKQVPGWFYSWELDRQPSWGPGLITKEGDLKFTPANPEKKRPAKLTGTGLSWFYAQVLIGDPVDTIPGLPNTGPVAAFGMLEGKTPKEQLKAVSEAYMDVYSPNEGYSELLEQGRLCWLTRRLNEDGSPVLWEIGMEE